MTTVVTTDVTAGTVSDAGVINNNFSSVKTAVNGGIDNNNIASSANIDVTKLAASGTNGHSLMTTGGAVAWGFAGPGDPVTSLPASPTDKQQALLVDSLTAPTYAWLFQYEAGITDSYKWMWLGGAPLVTTSHTTVRAGIYRVMYGGVWGAGGTTTAASHTAAVRNNGSNVSTFTIDAVSSADTGTGSRQRVSGVYGAETVTVTTAGHVIDTSGIDTPILTIFPVRVA